MLRKADINIAFFLGLFLEKFCAGKNKGKREKTSETKKMALSIPALPFTFVAHALAVVGLILVLVWNIDFRGGLAWESENKNLIFNVSFGSSLFLGFFISRLISGLTFIILLYASMVLCTQFLCLSSSYPCVVIFVEF